MSIELPRTNDRPEKKGTTAPPRLPYAYGEQRFAWAFMYVITIGGTWLVATTHLTFLHVFVFGDSVVAAWCGAAVYWLVMVVAGRDSRIVRADAAGIDAWRSGTRTQVSWSALAGVSHTDIGVVLDTHAGDRYSIDLFNAQGAVTKVTIARVTKVAATLDALLRGGAVDLSAPARAEQSRAPLPHAIRLHLAVLAIAAVAVALARTVGAIG